MLSPSDVSSKTPNFAALERPQRFRHGLTSIDATQESLIPWMESGGRSRGLRDFRWNGVFRPQLLVARETGVWWRRSETSSVDKCGRELIGCVTSGELRASGWLTTISANIVVALRWVEPGELPLPCLSMLLEFSLLHFGAATAPRKIRMRREVVEPPTETNAEDWLVAGRSTLSWCGRFVNRRSAVVLHSETREARLGSRVSRIRLAPVGMGRLL